MAEQRRLAAILAADMVGYSRLMEADEGGTIARQKVLRSELIDPKFSEHNGRIVKTTGDGMLVEFASVVDAVECAVAIQNAMTERETGVTGDAPRIQYRIGINVGDIVVEEDDIFGDGVNVAARIEGLCQPGEVCLSGSAYDHVNGKIELSFENLGEHVVKNISRPIQLYRINRDLNKKISNTLELSKTDGLTVKPSIAVLPFDNLSNDPEQEYFSDGITEDIITGLSRVGWFFVIARNSSFVFKNQSVDVKQVSRELGVRYVLEGSVRKAGNRVRVTAQLIEGETGAHIWAEKYDSLITDIFDMQDEITETIVGALEPELSKMERERSKSRQPEHIGAWDLYQRGMSHLYQYTKKDLEQARKQFEEAITLDENLGPAYSGIAEAYYYEAVYGFSGSMAENRELAIKPAQKAVELDPNNAGAHCTLGRIQYFRRNFDSAILELKTALKLNPSLALAHYGLGAAYVFSGWSAEGVPYLNTAIRLSPRDPNMGSFLVRLADASLFLGQYEEAVQWARKALLQPKFQWSRYSVLISALAHLGRLDEAQHYLQELLKLKPDFSLSFVREGHLFDSEEDFKLYLDGLKKIKLRA